MNYNHRHRGVRPEHHDDGCMLLDVIYDVMLLLLLLLLLMLLELADHQRLLPSRNPSTKVPNGRRNDEPN